MEQGSKILEPSSICDYFDAPFYVFKIDCRFFFGTSYVRSIVESLMTPVTNMRVQVMGVHQQDDPLKHPESGN